MNAIVVLVVCGLFLNMLVYGSEPQHPEISVPTQKSVAAPVVQPQAQHQEPPVTSMQHKEDAAKKDAAVPAQHQEIQPHGSDVAPVAKSETVPTVSAPHEAPHSVNEEAKTKEEQLPPPPAVVEDKTPVQEQKEATLPVSEEKKKTATSAVIDDGIDTIDQEGGNWLLKRQALEKTIDVIEKIKDVFTKILEIRIDYLVKRNQTDRSFDMFANSIGFELGDLNQLLTTLVSQLKAERKKDDDLDEQERAVLEDIENKISELKSLKATVNSITDLDSSLDDALMQLEKEITTSNSYQTRAWKNFQTIKKVLSDEKAEELYLQTESLYKNMQDILRYLQDDLLHYFNSVVDTLKQAMNSTQTKIKALSEKGIDLKDEVKKIKRAEKLARKKKTEALQDEKKKKEAIQQPKQGESKKASGWYDYVALVWQYPISLLSRTIQYVTGFFGTTKTVEVIKHEQPAGAAAKEDTKKVIEEQKSKK